MDNNNFVNETNNGQSQGQQVTLQKPAQPQNDQQSMGHCPEQVIQDGQASQGQPGEQQYSQPVFQGQLNEQQYNQQPGGQQYNQNQQYNQPAGQGQQYNQQPQSQQGQYYDQQSAYQYNQQPGNQQEQYYGQQAFQGQQYNQQPYQGQQAKSDGLEVISMVFGILSILTCCCFSGVSTLVFGIVGLVTALVYRKKRGEFNAMALTGLICSIIGLVFGVSALLVTILGFAESSVFDKFSNPDVHYWFGNGRNPF